MASNGWKYLRQLQNITRHGYIHLGSRRRDPDNSFRDELLVDLILIVIGLAIYIQLDIQPFLPFKLPDVIQHGSFAPIFAMVGLAIAGSGGLRLLVASLEAISWLVSKVFRGKKHDE